MQITAESFKFHSLQGHSFPMGKAYRQEEYQYICTGVHNMSEILKIYV